jgi:hypothetical protein
MRLKESQGGIRALVRERARAEAAALAVGEGPVIQSHADRDAEAALEGCKALAERGKVALAASIPDLTACAVAPGPAAGLAARLGPLAAGLGGKGGGGPAFFRASFDKRTELVEFMSQAAKNLQN